MADPEADDYDDKPQPLVAHLTELRDRLLRCVLVVLLIFLSLFYFANDIYSIVSEPLRRILPEGSSMIATEVASPFLTPFKLTMMVAVLISVTFLLHQAWAFIAPGLYRREKKIAAPLLVSSVLLFYAGIAFAYFVVFPLVFAFFTSTAPEGIAVMTDINSYLDFILTMFLAFGLAFEIPIATVLLIWTGVVTPEALTQKRPYVIVGCFVVGMVLTPPDIFSQTLLAVPVWLLFEAGVFFGRMIVRRGGSEPA